MFSENATDKAIRKFLVEADILDSVISIPAGIFEHTRIRTNILVIDKRKSFNRRGKVMFYDGFPAYYTVLDKVLIPQIAHAIANQILEGIERETMSEFVPTQQII